MCAVRRKAAHQPRGAPAPHATLKSQFAPVAETLSFYVAQDDFWYENKMALIEERFISSPKTSVVFTDGDVVDEDFASNWISTMGNV